MTLLAIATLSQVLRLFTSSLRLQLRSPAALAYGAAVPLVFLGAFWTIYRHESPPLARHLDELLVITALSGACFALPAWFVSEREHGVWRQYRLTPLPPAVHIAAMLGVSYILVLIAAVIQVIVTVAAGTPMPVSLVDLWIAFTLTSFAFLGIGLLITMLADTVPAAQALGQALFLPMLIVGGVAVPIEMLPPWAQVIAASLPGRYAVDAIGGALAGRGLADWALSGALLAVMGAASAVGAIAIGRWDARQHLGIRKGVLPAVLVIGSWIAIGATVPQPRTGRIAAAPAPGAPPVVVEPRNATAPPTVTPGSSSPSVPPFVRTSPVPSPGLATPGAASTPVLGRAERTWRDVTMEDVDVNLVFVALPPDHGVVTPISAEYRRREDVECVRRALPAWAPAGVPDVVQRSRNALLLLAVPDVLQMDIERDLPHAVFEHLQQTPKDTLFKVLYWIATHQSDGDLDALDHLAGACLSVTPPDDEDQLRERVAIYATKLLGRITGRIKTP